MTINSSKESEKKQRFLTEIFYGSPEFKSTIADEILRLCDLLPPQFRNETFETSWLSNEAKARVKIPSSESIISINKILQNRKLISKYEKAAFITSSMELASYDAIKFDYYKALVLFVIAELSLCGKHEPKILKLCNEIRQYSQGRRRSLIPLLPDISRYDFPSLIEYFDQQIETNDQLTRSQKGQLAYYRNPIRDSYRYRPGIQRRVGPREFKAGRTLAKSEAHPFDEHGNEFIAEVIEVSSQFTKQQGWQAEDQTQPERSLSVVTSKRFVNRERHLNIMQARAINNTISKNKMFLTCSINRTSDYAVSRLSQYCIQTIREETRYRMEAVVMLLMLFTGNTLEEIKGWKVARSDNSSHIIGVKRSLKLPSVKKLDSEVLFLTTNVQLDYVLSLPLNLVSDLSGFSFNMVSNKSLQFFLSEVKRHNQLSLTMSSISNYMKQKLIESGVDICIIELINGHNPQNEPARFYTEVLNKRLYDVYEDYYRHLLDLSQSEFLTDKHAQCVSGVLGSPLFIDKNKLQCLFHNFRTYFDAVDTASELVFSEAYHNMAVIRLQIILGIASGYRPVVDWYGNIKDIHLASGEYRIADKERSLESVGRVVVLPPIVLTILQTYLDFCERAMHHHCVNQPALSQRYRDALSGDQAFCFYITNGGCEVVTPSSYASHIDRIFPLQPNWTRHYLRSYLHKQGVSDELCGAWLGHQSAGQSPFGRYSQLRRRELIAISTLLEKHLCSLLGEKDDSVDR